MWAKGSNKRFRETLDPLRRHAGWECVDSGKEKSPDAFIASAREKCGLRERSGQNEFRYRDVIFIAGFLQRRCLPIYKAESSNFCGP